MQAVLVFIILGICFLIGIRRLERNMIYYPAKFPEGDWDTSIFPGRIEDCWFETADGLRLHGWFAHALTEDLNRQDQQPPTLLFCHGNAGNITHRLANVAYLIQLKIHVFIFDYRGYGKSQGSPGEQGLYRDAVAAYEYLLSREDVDPSRIVLFGRSLGGAVAVDLATKKPCDRLILESTFTSAKEMTRTMFGNWPMHYLIKSQFNSLARIADIHVPLLCLHGTQDTIVPFELGQRLFAAANEPKLFYAIQGADHNDTYEIGGRAYFEALSRFIHSAPSSV